MAGSQQWPDDLVSYLGSSAQNDQFSHEVLQLEQAKAMLYKQAYQELCLSVTGDAPSDEPPDESEFSKSVLKFLNKNRDRAYEEICVKFNYCAKRKQYQYWTIPIPFFLLLIAYLAELGLTGGMASASWLTLSGTLDAFCEC